MLQPTPMQMTTLYVLREDAPAAALALAHTSAFEPVVSEVSPEMLPELPGAVFRERLHSASNRLEKLLCLCCIDFSRFAAPPAQAPRYASG